MSEAHRPRFKVVHEGDHLIDQITVQLVHPPNGVIDLLDLLGLLKRYLRSIADEQRNSLRVEGRHYRTVFWQQLSAHFNTQLDRRLCRLPGVTVLHVPLGYRDRTKTQERHYRKDDSSNGQCHRPEPNWIFRDYQVRPAGGRGWSRRL